MKTALIIFGVVIVAAIASLVVYAFCMAAKSDETMEGIMDETHEEL